MTPIQGLMSNSYKGKNWMYNPNIPMSMCRSTHILLLSSLENASFLEYADCVLPAAMYIPANSHISINCFELFSLSVAWWCFSTSGTVKKYATSYSDMYP